ncbi:MAG: glycosyltransferase family 4 protein [Clostridiales bacterium]|nr:glycosyltransferase family 4 protein [Clostridiales bacterium]
MKIGQFTDTFLPITDGVGRVVHAYALGLSNLSHEVTVVAPLYNTGQRGHFPFELVDYLSYPVPTAPQYKIGSPRFDKHYRKRIEMIPMDIMHTHGPFSAGREALRLAKNRKTVPLVASFHSKYYDDFYKATKSASISKVIVKNLINFYEKCDDVWAVSTSTGEVLRQYGFKGHIRIMPNGVTLRTPKQDSFAQLEERLKIHDEPMLLFVGQINWKKNLLRILEAAALLKSSGKDFRLCLVGQGPDEQEVQQKILDLGIADQTLMTGHIGDADLLDALYQRASLFVFPSLYDNAPMVLREAAVMGTPSVLIIGSDAAEVVEDGRNGLLCSDTSQDLSDTISAALDDPQKIKELGLAAQQSIPISWDSLMHDIVDAYEQVIDRFQYKLKTKQQK